MRRSTTAIVAMAAAEMNSAKGSPSRYPLATNSSGSLLTVVMKPSVMSRATPRPASMSTRVAMIGWIRKHGHQEAVPHARVRTPTAMPTPIATRTVPTSSGLAEPSMMVRVTAPETAMTAPTERSIPRVAITSVMPSATSIRGALLRRMSISAP